MYQVSHVLHPILKPLLKEGGFRHTEIFRKWDQIIGKDLSTFCEPQRVQKNNKGGGVLVVGIKSSSAALPLKMRQNLILERLNVFLGYKAFSDLRFVPSVAKSSSLVPQKKDLKEEEKTHIYSLVSDIQSRHLQDALYELGCSIAREKNDEK